MRMRLRPLPPVLAAALLLGGAALATSSYPSVLRQEAGAERSPRCIVCHETNSGGSGTSTKPFSLALQARGLPSRGSNSAELRTAFAKLAADRIDTDGDGTIDTQEITEARDPNIARNEAAGIDDAMYPTTGTDGGTDAGTDGGVVEPPVEFVELPDAFYGVGCSSVGGMQALGGLLLLGAAVLRAGRRRE